MRTVKLVALVAATLLLSGCLGLFVRPTLDRTFDIPANFDQSVIPQAIRSRVASDFPGYRIVEGSSDDEDALLTLRSISRPFYMAVDYRNPKAYHEPAGPYYYVTGSPGDIDMRQLDDPKVASLIDFFSARFPHGERVFDGTEQEDPESDGLVYQINLHPARSVDSSGGGPGDEWSEKYRYDSAAHTWSLAE